MDLQKSTSYQCCIIGAGPAGLGAALELSKHGVNDIVIVDRNQKVGGLLRTEIFNGVRFDIGPHRFFTKNREINTLWHEMLGSDFRPVKRLTRIHYSNKLFNYPIRPFDVLPKLGLLESFQAMLSFSKTLLRPGNTPRNFEEWIVQKFGRKLYQTFFKVYTEKVWGIPCDRISPEWAAQRIKDLDMIQLLKHVLRGFSRNNIKTLVEQFDYPLLGAGQMYEAMADTVKKKGVKIRLGEHVTSYNRQDQKIVSIDVSDESGNTSRIYAGHFFSSIPMTRLCQMISPAVSSDIADASDALFFRDHITVNLLLDAKSPFPDQWIYIHSPDVKMARIANYNNFSPRMVANEKQTALSVEYFVFQNEDLWGETDATIADLALDEMAYLGLLDKKTLQNAWVIRETECYPTYYIGYQQPYEKIKRHLDRFENLFTIGRGGMYQYNNQDHSLLSGIIAARKYLQQPEWLPYNLWEINVDSEYLEDA